MLKRYNGIVRVHPAASLYGGVHIDTTLTLLGFNRKLQKYVVVANPDRVTPSNIPVIFRGKNWVVINSPQMVDVGYEEGFEIASAWIGMNFLVLGPDLVLIDKA